MRGNRWRFGARSKIGPPEPGIERPVVHEYPRCHGSHTGGHVQRYGGAPRYHHWTGQLCCFFSLGCPYRSRVIEACAVTTDCVVGDEFMWERQQQQWHQHVYSIHIISRWLSFVFILLMVLDIVANGTWHISCHIELDIFRIELNVQYQRFRIMSNVLYPPPNWRLQVFHADPKEKNRCIDYRSRIISISFFVYRYRIVSNSLLLPSR